MTDGKYTLSDVHSTYKAKDAWWTVLLVDPIASRLVVPVANYTNITPNQISAVSFVVGMFAAYSFYVGSAEALLVGAILYHISFILDCMDGKIARLKGTAPCSAFCLTLCSITFASSYAVWHLQSDSFS